MRRAAHTQIRRAPCSVADMFYFVLHNVIPETSRFRDGRRNCMTFMLGSALYVAVWVMMQQHDGHAQQRVSTTAMWLLWMADALTMAYIYKSHYGRSVVHELLGDESWEFDTTTHKYRRLTWDERHQRKEARAVEGQGGIRGKQCDNERDVQ